MRNSKLLRVLASLVLVWWPYAASAQLAMTGAGVTGQPFSLTDTDCTAISGTTITFTAKKLGGGGNGKINAVSISWADTTAAGTASITGVTIAGNTATKAVAAVAGATNSNAEIWYAQFNGGGNGDIVVTTATAVNRMTIAVYRLTNFPNAAPNSTATGTTTATAQTFPNDGLIGVGTRSDASSTTLSNLNQDFSTSCGSGQWGVHGSSFPNIASNLSTTINPTTNTPLIALADWRPSSNENNSLTVEDNFQSTAPGSTVTRSTVTFGTASTNRVIVVAFSWSAAANRTISSVTIGGVTATKSQDTLDSGAASAGSAIYYAQPGGTTGNVVVTFSNTLTEYSGIIYRITPPGGPTPIDGNKVSGGAINTSKNVPEVVTSPGMIIMSLRYGGTSAVTPTYTGSDTLTTDINTTLNAAHIYVGVSGVTTQNTGTNIGGSAGTGQPWFITASTWGIDFTTLPVATISIITTQSGSAGTTITLSGLDFGAADSNRVIVVAMSWATTLQETLPTNVAIGDVATATIAQNQNGFNVGAFIAYAQPSGTTGQTITITCPSAVPQFGLAVYRITPFFSTPFTGNNTSASSTNVTVGVTTANGGVLIESGRSGSAVATLTSTTTGVNTFTDAVNAPVSNSTYASSFALLTETAARSVGYSTSASINKQVAAVVWR